MFHLGDNISGLSPTEKVLDDSVVPHQVLCHHLGDGVFEACLRCKWEVALSVFYLRMMVDFKGENLNKYDTIG